jgi:hypothetical protein
MKRFTMDSGSETGLRVGNASGARRRRRVTEAARARP